MPTDEIIIRLYCIVADTLSEDNKRADAHLYPSEIVTIGLLFALKGGQFRRFYRWFRSNYGSFFPKLPERTRLQRLLRDYSELAEDFLVDPTFFTVVDTYGVELIHPRREGRSSKQLGRKGKSNGRWIVGVKLAWLVDSFGRVVDWIWDTANAPDQDFRDLPLRYDGQTIVLSDFGFRAADEPQHNLKYCQRGTWNERYKVESCFGFLEGVCHTKKVFHRVESHLSARFWYAAALLNCLLVITEGKIEFAQFAL
jgi:hypothetical protein